MALKLKNNATTVLAGSITDSATSLSVQAGKGALFPTLSVGDWFPLTLRNSSGSYEIVKVTARATDVFTIVRAQEGTAGTAFTAGDRADLRITAAALDTFVQAATALLQANNLSDLASAATARTNLGLGSAAVQDAAYFATAAQGAKADAAAVAASLATVATSGSYNDLLNKPAATSTDYNALTNKPTLGTAASKDTGTTNGAVVMVGAGNKLPAIDGSDLTNVHIGFVDPTAALPIGYSGLMVITTGSVANNANVAGTSLRPAILNYMPAYTSGDTSYNAIMTVTAGTVAQAGQWKNISGDTIALTPGNVVSRVVGTFQRVS